MFKKLRSFSVLMLDIFQLFRKNHRGGVEDFQVVVEVSFFVRNPVYSDVKIEMQKINDKHFIEKR